MVSEDFAQVGCGDYRSLAGDRRFISDVVEFSCVVFNQPSTIVIEDIIVATKLNTVL